MAKSMYMVVEYFKNKDAIAVCRRFRDHGRLAPEGLLYISSWVDNKLERRYQLIETHDHTLLDEWMENWSDLVDFEVHPVHRTKRQTKSRHDYSSHRRNDPSVLATECNHLTISLTVSVLIDRVAIPRSSVVVMCQNEFHVVPAAHIAFGPTPKRWSHARPAQRASPAVMRAVCFCASCRVASTKRPQNNDR